MEKPKDRIHFVDTTLRDGHQSLWAEGMRTGMMLAVAERMDRAGFDAMELMSSSHIKKCVRELREDPWERVRLVGQLVARTPLRVIMGSRYGFEPTPVSVQRLFLERMVANGVRQARISDEWNDASGWQRTVKVAHDVGLAPVVNLIYSVSPKHTDEYYAQRARQAATLGAFRLCLKDPGGLLTPGRMQTLVPLIFENIGNTTLELHTHCTTGLGPLCCVEAVRLGIRILNTAIPPLANGSSNPSVFNVASNVRALGFQPVIRENLIKPVSEYFTFIARREALPIGEPVEYDYSQYLHQVPGGMISNLRHQLQRVGLGGHMERALEEVVRVRAEFGYPIMVTPLSQYVGSQAVINIVLGERYKEVTDQVILYALGRWGREGSEGMDPEVKDKVLGRPRAEELSRWEPPAPSIEDLRQKLGAVGFSDEELLLRYFLNKEEIDAMRSAGPPRQYLDARQPLVRLLEAISKLKGYARIYIQKGDLSVRLGTRETHETSSRDDRVVL
jgi:oxaloacetate decarboxylase alpha subunit